MIALDLDENAVASLIPELFADAAERLLVIIIHGNSGPSRPLQAIKQTCIEYEAVSLTCIRLWNQWKQQVTDKVKTAKPVSQAQKAKARLAEALRANLAKRKAQSRARHRDTDDSANEIASPAPQTTPKGQGDNALCDRSDRNASE
jgi:hypothetical protein